MTAQNEPLNSSETTKASSMWMFWVFDEALIAVIVDLTN
jgi:hypothetical protein